MTPPPIARKTRRQTNSSQGISGDPAVAQYLDDLRERDFSAASIRVYTNDLSLFVRWYESQTRQPFETAKLTAIDLQSYRGHLQNVEDKKPSTINRRLQVLRGFSRWAHEAGSLAEDVGRNVHSIATVQRPSPKGIARNEINAFLRVAATSPRGQGKRNYAVLQTLLQTGVRAGELVSLKVGDVTIKQRVGTLRVRGGKGRKAREVPLDASVRQALHAYLEQRGNPSADQPLFLSERAGAMKVRGLEHLIRALGHRAGIERDEVTVHTWRHTFALAYLKDHPQDLVSLARLLGHERLDTTAIYTQPSAEDLARKLEEGSLNVYGG